MTGKPDGIGVALGAGGVGAADQGARGRSRDANRGLRSRGGTPAPRLCTGVGLPATEARSDGLNSVTGCTLTSRSFRPTPLQGLPYSIYPSTQLPSCPLLQEASLGTPGGPDPRHTVVPHGVDLQTPPPAPPAAAPGASPSRRTSNPRPGYRARPRRLTEASRPGWMGQPLKNKQLGALHSPKPFPAGETVVWARSPLASGSADGRPEEDGEAPCSC